MCCNDHLLLLSDWALWFGLLLTTAVISAHFGGCGRMGRASQTGNGCGLE